MVVGVALTSSASDGRPIVGDPIRFVYPWPILDGSGRSWSEPEGSDGNRQSRGDPVRSRPAGAAARSDITGNAGRFVTACQTLTNAALGTLERPRRKHEFLPFRRRGIPADGGGRRWRNDLGDRRGQLQRRDALTL